MADSSESPPQVLCADNEISYPYHPLCISSLEIRLLHLDPGEPDDPVQATLIAAPLTPQLSFEALSYTWGDPAITTPIYLFSETSPQRYTFNATTSLASALLHIRLRRKPRILWVDSICINQASIPEKEHQVRHMDLIYKSAFRVLVWLGEAADYSDEVFHLIKTGPRTIDEAIALLPDPRWGTAWQALTALVQRPWFSRCWIVQEQALGHEVVLLCGWQGCYWDDFMLIIFALVKETYAYSTNKELPPDSRRGAMCPALANWEIPDEHFYFWFHGNRNILCLEVARASVGKVDMKGFLAIGYGRMVTDSRDAVYSILGMARNPEAMRWEVDYEKDVVDVFMDAVENIVLSTRSLNILCHSEWSEEHNHSHSWIPRFAGGFEGCGCDGYLLNSLTMTEILIPDGGRTQELTMNTSVYTASGTTIPKIHFDKPNRQINIKGVIITTISKSLDLPTSYRGGLSIPQSWKEYALTSLDTFWRTITANREQLTIFQSDLDRPILSFESYDEIFIQDNNFYLSQARAPAPVEWAEQAREWLEGDMRLPDTGTTEFTKAALGYLRSKTLVLTEGGSGMALAPVSSKEGDLVCVLWGCSVPVVLRRMREKGKDGEEFWLVGEVYVHGMMDGEVVGLLEGGRVEERDFSII